MTLRASDDVIEHERDFFNDVYQAGTVLPHEFLDVGPEFLFACRLLGGVAGKKILDLGCGTGATSLALAVRGARVYGVDVADEAITALNANAKRYNVRLEGASRMTATELDFPDASFDGVFGARILHHIVHHPFGRQAMDEIHRVLKPGGAGVFLENNGDNHLLMFVRSRMGWFGAQRTGDELERPLTEAALQAAAATFDRFSFYYPELFLFRMPTTWIPGLRGWGLKAERVDHALSFSQRCNRLGWSRLVYVSKTGSPAG